MYHTKYRPQSFKTVYGQHHIVGAISSVVDKGTAQAFMFSGPSGVGKTTMARIVAKMVGCEERDILEVDAATFSGIDRMREIQNLMQYRPIGGGTARAVIIDEAHGLSKNAWDALLKATEEPKDGVFWFFCTTNPAKVPGTIKTRCATFTLKSVSEAELERIVTRVIKKEELEVSDGVVQIICREANGSPRQALVNLAQCAHCKTAKETLALLQKSQDTDATLELCRFVVNGGSWQKAMAIVKKLKEQEENPEGVRILVANYVAVVLMGAKSDKAVVGALAVLDAFSTPYNQAEGFAPLLLSIGQVLDFN